MRIKFVWFFYYIFILPLLLNEPLRRWKSKCHINAIATDASKLMVQLCVFYYRIILHSLQSPPSPSSSHQSTFSSMLVSNFLFDWIVNTKDECKKLCQKLLSIYIWYSWLIGMLGSGFGDCWFVSTLQFFGL